jgi:hypothetical protein
VLKRIAAAPLGASTILPGTLAPLALLVFALVMAICSASVHMLPASHRQIHAQPVVEFDNAIAHSHTHAHAASATGGQASRLAQESVCCAAGGHDHSHLDHGHDATALIPTPHRYVFQLLPAGFLATYLLPSLWLWHYRLERPPRP